MKRLIFTIIITLFITSTKAQMVINKIYIEPNPGCCTYSFVFYEAISQNGALVKKKLAYNVETTVIAGKDTIRSKMEDKFANLYLLANLYNKEAEYIFACEGYETLRVKRKMESPWLAFDVFLTKKEE